MKSKRVWLAVAVLVPLLALIALLGWGLARTGGRPGGLLINNKLGEVTIRQGPARPFTLSLMDGRELGLDQLKGKLVMVDFWASWCPPCRQEAPELSRAYRKYRDRGVEFVGIAIWDTKSEVARYMRKYGVEFPVGLDEKGLIAIDYGLTGIPEKYFITPDGVLLRKFIGPMSEAELSAVLDGLLARRQRPVSEIRAIMRSSFDRLRMSGKEGFPPLVVSPSAGSGQACRSIKPRPSTLR